MRQIQAGEGVLSPAGIQRVLGESRGIGAAKSAEDLAYVVQGLAEGVTAPHCQLLEQIVGAEFHLGRFIVGETTIVADSHNPCAAINTSYVSTSA